MPWVRISFAETERESEASTFPPGSLFTYKMTFHYKFGEDVPTNHFSRLASIRNKFWAPESVTPEDIEMRLNSGHPMLVGYHNSTPFGTIEMIALSSHHPNDVNLPFSELAKYWETTPDENADLLLFATISQIIPGMGGLLMERGLYTVAPELQFQHFRTLTPNNDVVINFHEKHGAIRGSTIPNGRPGYNPKPHLVGKEGYDPTTIIHMNYDFKIHQIRKELGLRL